MLRNMELTVKTTEDKYIIHIEGDVDLYNAPDLKSAFRDGADKGYKNYVVDLEKVDYLDSSVIGALIYGAGIAKKLGGKMSCINTRTELVQLFKTINLSKLLGVTGLSKVPA